MQQRHAYEQMRYAALWLQEERSHQTICLALGLANRISLIQRRVRRRQGAEHSALTIPSAHRKH